MIASIGLRSIYTDFSYTLGLFSHKSHLNITGSTSIWAGNPQGSLKAAGERLQIQQRLLLPRNLDLQACFPPAVLWAIKLLDILFQEM